MIDYWMSKNKEHCCGCRSCEYACGKNAIKMEKDNEGFIYPVVDEELCVYCGICNQVCPYETTTKKKTPKEVLATQNKNRSILRDSSSGGVFRALAEYVIKNDGYVVGCVFDEQNKAKLVVSNKLNMIQQMQGSKYVFSDTNDTFKEIKHLLRNNKLVLFTGSPCQCYALKCYLHNDYDHLIVADFLCHGMPSQLVLDKYINHLSKKDKVGINSIKFRDKQHIDWGLCFSYMGKKHRYKVGDTDPYLYGFTKGFFNRKNCYSCKFKGIERVSDFTFCDFWGIERLNLHLNFKIKNGVSALMVNTDKAVKIRKELENSLSFFESSVNDVSLENKSLVLQENEEIPKIRNSIYREIQQDSWDSVEKKYLKCASYSKKKIWYSLPKSFRNVLKEMLRRLKK